MSKNVQQVYIANPSTTLPDTALMYAGLSPFASGNDTAITFSNLKTQIAAAAEPYPPTYAQGCGITYASATTLTIATGLAKSLDKTTNIVVSSPLTLNFAANGANGLDTGSVAANTLYSIFVIYNPNTLTTASLASASTTSTPTSLPSGYTQYRRIGWWYTKPASTNLQFYQQTGEYNQRTYTYGGDAANNILNGGSATSFTTLTLSSVVPPTCMQITMTIAVISGVVTLANNLLLRTFGSSSTGQAFIYNTNNTGATAIQATIGLSDDLKFDYKVGAGTVTAYMDLTGFIDYI